MEKIKLKYLNLKKAFDALQRIIEKYNNPPKTADREDIAAYETTLVKRFELTNEMLWKYFKAYLKQSQGTDTMGSKDVFRKCFEYKLITESALSALLNAIDDCNSTAHDYDEDFAHQMCKKIVGTYFSVIQEITQRIDLQQR